MLDFLVITSREKKKDVIEVYPKFIINNKSQDLMIRGGDFYAVWVEERGLWSTDEQDLVCLVDKETKACYEKTKAENPGKDVYPLYMWDAETGIIDKWHKYCQKQCRDNFQMLDEKLIFSNNEVNKKDYSSKRLSYPLEKGDITAWDKLIGTLYDPEERHKIEWSIGSIVTGDSKDLQKFMVLYGSAGAGKSTILNVIQQLFDGYYATFDAKALGSNNGTFALEPFKCNPLVAIQHDGDLSKIEDNTRLNSLVSHEYMTVNEKFKSTYSSRFKCFLFMGTNKPVRITDAKSGLIRRLIDVTPSGRKLSSKEYKATVKQVQFELGAIAHHCMDVYLEDPNYYDNYVPIAMMGASNDFYNYILDSYSVFVKEDGITLKTAWEMYKKYCDDANVSYPMSKRVFKEELKNYFDDFQERSTTEEGGSRICNKYYGFQASKFQVQPESKKPPTKDAAHSWIQLEEMESIFDSEFAGCKAQYATIENEAPKKKWDKTRITLDMLDTKKVHYVKVPENHIVIDFDIPDESGNKSLAKNLEAANKWPPTYAEVSKGGQGLHLHYNYKGDASKLSRIYDDHIEVKIFNGGGALRRRLSKCNNLPIASISSGLPLKKEANKVVNFDSVQSEKGLRSLIARNLNKEIHASTKPSIDFIYKILEDAYNSGMKYDVSDTRNSILAFAASSTHQSDYCMKLVSKMKFKSEEQNTGEVQTSGQKDEIIFYDIEVFPNLFLINWKLRGKGNPIVRMINPSISEIENLLQYKLIGFNCRRYDNHLVYGRWMGYDNEALYNLSQRIINGDRTAFFSQAYDLSYTDVYDFASAGNKMSLKKLEIQMSREANDPNSKMDDDLRELLKGIKHHELGLPWDKPVPEELWPKVAEYCDDDVLATEAAFEYLAADWTARQILADLAGMNVNTSTNTLTTKIIFGDNKKPQSEFYYRNLAEPVKELDKEAIEFLNEACPDMMAQKHGEEQSLLPYFPGYEYKKGVSTYRGEEVGEGGYVYAEPGMYGNAALLDIASMHPHSLIAEILFGIRYTKAFRDIVEGRVSIKHEAWDIVNNMLEGKLTPYIEKVKRGEMTSGQLADALKTAINSVYGLTSARFENAFKDIRNIDNIVAKRGALFMVDLKHAVQEKGFKVAHIKTDSIKIPDATPEIIQFVKDFGAKYGYTFEHEATYERMCLVNDAVYIAKYADMETCEKIYGKEYLESDPTNCSKNKKKAGKWDATGKQFAVPYLFKKLFSKEEITFYDMCETFQVQTSLYLDMNENLPDVSLYEGIKENRRKIKDKIEITKKATSILDEYRDMSDEDLDKAIAMGHDYKFVGKIGEFCPVKTGAGGGLLLREGSDKNGNVKYASATGSKGYRWMESQTVKELGLENMIDRSYYEELVNDAIESLISYGNYEWFVSDDPYIPPEYINGVPNYNDTIPFQ